MSDFNSPKYGRHSIRFKLVTASIIVQVAILSLLVWNSTRLASEHLIRQAETHIQETLPLLNASIAGPLLQEDMATLGEILDQVINEHSLRYIAVFDASDNLFIERGLSSTNENIKPIKNMLLRQHIASGIPESPYRLRIPVTIANSVTGYLEFELNTFSIKQAIVSIRKQGISIAVAGIIVSILLLTFLAVTITRNLLKLTDAVSSISPGDETVDTIIDSKDEVGGLSQAFKKMAEKLRQREQESDAASRATRESDARYKRLVENLGSEYFFYSHNTDGVFFYVSESITRVLGYTQSDFLSRYDTYLTDNPINNNLISRVNNSQTEKRCSTFVISIYHKDGSERMLEISESPVVDNAGKVLMMEGIAHDITTSLQEADELRQHRDNLEVLVAKRTSELETINNELESFCYSVSHDLRAPLRGINGFSNALLEDYAHVLDETGKNYLARITLGTQRMSSLIDDLLNLSRITRYKMNIQPIDLTEIAKETIRTLRENEPDRSVNISLEEGLHAMGDKNLLTIALSNLIGNAWKYTGKRDNAKISIYSSIDENKTRIFSICDNGAGFDPKYVDKIFLPFQRLHRADDFPGNGVGLSTVHRIITRHQGKIWARAKEDEGASFHFTLEISQPPSDKT